MPFEILDFLFVFLRSFHRMKGSQITAFLRLWIHFTGVKPVLPGF